VQGTKAPDALSAVADFFSGAAATLRETDYADACPIATVALEVASTNETLRQVTAGVFGEWMDAITDRAARHGLPPERARVLAPVLVAALEGGFLLSRAAKDATAMRVIGEAMVELVTPRDF
jgi:AcrR family transcriptional regulator